MQKRKNRRNIVILFVIFASLGCLQTAKILDTNNEVVTSPAPRIQEKLNESISQQTYEPGKAIRIEDFEYTIKRIGYVEKIGYHNYKPTIKGINIYMDVDMRNIGEKYPIKFLPAIKITNYSCGYKEIYELIGSKSEGDIYETGFDPYYINLFPGDYKSKKLLCEKEIPEQYYDSYNKENFLSGLKVILTGGKVDEWGKWFKNRKYDTVEIQLDKVSRYQVGSSPRDATIELLNFRVLKDLDLYFSFRADGERNFEMERKFFNETYQNPIYQDYCGTIVIGNYTIKNDIAYVPVFSDCVARYPYGNISLKKLDGGWKLPPLGYSSQNKSS